MNEKFLLDDILKEYDSKKSEKGANPSLAGVKMGPPDGQSPPFGPISSLAFAEEVDSLTVELQQIENRRFGEVPAPQKPNLSVTQILSEQRQDEIKEKPVSDLSITQIIDMHTSEKAAKLAKINPKSIAPPPKVDTKPQEIPSQPVLISRFPAKKRSVNPEKAQKTSKNTPSPDEPLHITKRGAAKAAKVARTAEVEALSPIPDAHVEKPCKPAYLVPPPPIEGELAPEEKQRLLKLREAELLEKELALEEPEELIDGINAYGVAEFETPPTPPPTPAPVAMKIGGSETLVMSNIEVFAEESKQEEPTSETGEDDVKEFTPMIKGGDLTPLFEPVAEGCATTAKGEKFEELDITPVLETLNKSFVEQRKESINARTLTVDDDLSTIGRGGGHKGKEIPTLNINYKTQILQDSSALPPKINIRARQLEQQELRKKGKRKLRDFIYEDIDEEDDDFYYAEDEDSDYDSFDSSEQVWQDLDESHKSLKRRFAVLLLLTLVLGALTLIHDLGNRTSLQLRLIEQFGGLSNYSSVLIFSNIIAGVIGICLCSGAIFRGLKNLFAGRADCDSACAVPVVLTTMSVFIYLLPGAQLKLLEMGRTHLYVVVALAALLFNTLGKIFMIVRTKKNFAFISGDSVKYSAFMPNIADERAVCDFTKGMLHDVPATVFLRKTEFLTDYLKNSYCTDWADLICRKLVPISTIASILIAFLAYFLPGGDEVLNQNHFWAFTAGGAFVAVLSPFSIMFLVNNPLLKAAKVLSKRDCVVMGYSAANKFSKVNAVVIDAGMLFPPGSVKFLNVKRCQKPHAIDSISINESIIIAASLAIKTDSIMSTMFYDMISGDKDLLRPVEGCVYEVNMGITGWMGAKRIMLGNREQMKQHGVDVPAEKKERLHCPDNAEIVYLAVGSESVAMFIIEVVPNPAVKHSLRELDDNGVVLAVKTKDSLVTKSKLSDIYDLNPECVKILSFNQHSTFDDYSKYTSRGGSEIACNGTFTSFAKALVTAKNLIRDMMVTSATVFVSLFIAAITGLLLVIFAGSGTEHVMSASWLLLYNSVWLVIMLILQSLRRY